MLDWDFHPSTSAQERIHEIYVVSSTCFDLSALFSLFRHPSNRRKLLKQKDERPEECALKMWRELAAGNIYEIFCRDS
jgi:hypothetical protein